MARAKVRRCEHKKKGINFCVNHCPYADEGDCIDGKPIPKEEKELTVKEEAGKMMYKKYYEFTPEQKAKARARARDNYRKYPELYKRNVRKWNKAHPEETKYNSRKHMRRKRVEAGTALVKGEALINGKPTIIYNGRKNLYYFVGNEYFEVEPKDLDCYWIERNA